MALFSGTGSFTADGGKVHDIRFNTSGAVELNADVRGISGNSDIEIDGGSLMDSDIGGALLISGVSVHVNNVECDTVEISGNRCVVDDLHSAFADGVGVTISGNENRVRGRVYVAPEHGVLISGDDNDVEMTVAESGNDNSNTFDNIQITGNANYVHDCKLTPRPAGNTTRYGINVVSGTGNIVVGHDLGELTDYGTGGLADTGTGTLIGPGAHEWDLDLPANRTDGDVIVWDDATGKFILDEVTGSGIGGGGAEVLDDLTDVDTTGVVTGDVLKYNGTIWAPADDEEGSGVSGGGGAEEISDLTDVDATSAVEGDLLQFVSGIWTPVDPDSLGISGVGGGGGRVLLASEEILSQVTAVVITGLSQDYDDLEIILIDVATTDAADQDTPLIQFGGSGGIDTGTNYGWDVEFGGSSDGAADGTNSTAIPTTSFPVLIGAGEASAEGSYVRYLVFDYARVGVRLVELRGHKRGGDTVYSAEGGGGWYSAGGLEQVRVSAEDGDLTAGEVFVYGITR